MERSRFSAGIMKRSTFSQEACNKRNPRFKDVYGVTGVH